MATSEMVTSYPDWIQTRWETLYDNVASTVGDTGTGTSPTFDAPDYLSYHGATTITTNAQMAALVALSAETLMDNYWDKPFGNGVAFVEGLGAKEDEVYQMWKDLDSVAGSQTQIDNASEALLTQAVNLAENELFPAAQQQFLSTNCVFSSVYARFILDRYDKVNDVVDKFSADARLQQLDKGATRTVEMAKLAAQRKQGADSLRAELMLKKTSMITALEELRTKLVTTINQSVLQDEFNLDKANLAYDTSVKRWKLDNYKYQIEALAGIHGATPLSKSSSEEGWAAMSGFEKTMSVGSAAVGLAGGIASLGSDMDWW